MNTRLLTEREGRAGEYWPEVVAVRALYGTQKQKMLGPWPFRWKWPVWQNRYQERTNKNAWIYLKTTLPYNIVACLELKSWFTVKHVFMSEGHIVLILILFSHLFFQYFNNEQFEAERYDRLLADYEKASLKTTTRLALLSWGQNFIFSASLSIIMVLASRQILQGTWMSVVTL